MYKFLFLIIFSGWASNSNCQQTKFSFTREKMGSPFTIILYDADSTHATTTVENSFKLVDSLVNIFSDYINESELNRLSNSSGLNKNVTVSKDLYDIMVQSEKAFKMSNGAFDITVGPLTRLWRKARKEKVFPDDSAVINSKRKTGFNKIRIDHTNRKVQLSDPGMRLDLGGIAQGFIGQKVLDQLAQSSIKIALVNVSGDIVVSDPPPGKKSWTIGINLPESEEQLQSKNLALQNCAVSTSGDVYQFIEHKGKRYSHIIDPRTGYGVTSQKNVTAIAHDGTTADWLSTACSILSVKKAKRLAKKMKAGLIIAQMKNNRIKYYRTKNIETYYLKE